MGYNSDVFQQQFPLVKFFVYHLTYHRQIQNLYDGISFKFEFWTYTNDAHLLQAAILDTTVSILEGKIYPLLQRLLQDTQEYNQDAYPL